MGTVHKHEPYPFHLWLNAKRHLIERIFELTPNYVHPQLSLLVNEFFESCVTEYGIENTCTRQHLEYLKLVTDKDAGYEQYMLANMASKIGTAIMDSGAYAKEVRHMSYGDRTTTIRVLALNFGKFMDKSKVRR